MRREESTELSEPKDLPEDMRKARRDFLPNGVFQKLKKLKRKMDNSEYDCVGDFKDLTTIICAEFIGRDGMIMSDEEIDSEKTTRSLHGVLRNWFLEATETDVNQITKSLNTESLIVGLQYSQRNVFSQAKSKTYNKDNGQLEVEEWNKHMIETIREGLREYMSEAVLGMEKLKTIVDMSEENCKDNRRNRREDDKEEPKKLVSLFILIMMFVMSPNRSTLIILTLRLMKEIVRIFRIMVY